MYFKVENTAAVYYRAIAHISVYHNDDKIIRFEAAEITIQHHFRGNQRLAVPV